MADLNGLDYFLVVASIFAVLAIAVYTTFLQLRDKAAQSFFLAGRDVPFWITTCSLFASNIGAEHFVGQAGTAAASGLAVATYEWTAGFLVLALGWIFAPIYLRTKLTTIPQFMEERFNKETRFIFVIVTLLAYVVTKIGATLYAGVILFDVILGLSPWQSAPLIIIFTATYTALGGLLAVMLTDTVQMLIFVVGGMAGTVAAFSLVGGQSGLFNGLEQHNLGYFRHVWRDARDHEFPWPGMLVGVPLASIWYWCIDQEMAQRVLSSRSLGHTELGCALAALLKVLPGFITVMPGMVARLLYENCKKSQEDDGVVGNPWCSHDNYVKLDTEQGANKAYPLLVLFEFPHGVKGLLVAAFLAATMSSLASVYNSAATIFTYDVYERFFESNGGGDSAKAQSRQILVGRLTTAALTVLSFLWLPIVHSQKEGLYIVTQAAGAHLSPTIVGVFLAGILSKRVNGKGALAGFGTGLGIGLVHFVVSLVEDERCDSRVQPDNTLPLTAGTWFSCINFMYFTLLLFVLVVAVTMIVSYTSEPPRPEQYEGKLVWDNFRKGDVKVAIRTHGVPESLPQEERQAQGRVMVDLSGTEVSGDSGRAGDEGRKRDGRRLVAGQQLSTDPRDEAADQQRLGQALSGATAKALEESRLRFFAMVTSWAAMIAVVGLLLGYG